MLPSEGQFAQSVREACSLLRRVSLVQFINAAPHRGVVSAARTAGSHRAEYDVYVQAAAYDVMLTDGSILLFRRAPATKTELCYQYFASPYEVESFDDFVAAVRAGNPGDNAPEELYDLYRDQASLRTGDPLTLRYDWSPALYRQGAHPAGHLHIGYRTEMRLAVDLILLPHEFVHFVLRQYYTWTWEQTVLKIPKVVARARRLRVMPFPAEYLEGDDHCELRMR